MSVHPNQQGDQPVVTNDDIDKLADDETIDIEIPEDANDVSRLSFTEEQIAKLKDRNATIHIDKKDAQLTIPASLFTDDGLDIGLIQI